ncbi:hypothetical protein L917_06058, partial [Phytophthora nicotianae]
RHAHIISSAPSNKTTLGKTQRKARTDNASPVGNTSSLLYENPSQQPIAQRLKVEVVIPDTHAALVGLLCWARFYVCTGQLGGSASQLRLSREQHWYDRLKQG